MNLFQKMWQFWLAWCAFCDYSAFQRAGSACVPLAADGFNYSVPDLAAIEAAKNAAYLETVVDHFDDRLPAFKHLHGTARRHKIRKILHDFLTPQMILKAKDDA